MWLHGPRCSFYHDILLFFFLFLFFCCCLAGWLIGSFIFWIFLWILLCFEVKIAWPESGSREIREMCGIRMHDVKHQGTNTRKISVFFLILFSIKFFCFCLIFKETEKGCRIWEELARAGGWETMITNYFMNKKFSKK